MRDIIRKIDFMSGEDGRLAFWKVVIVAVIASYLFPFFGVIPLGVASLVVFGSHALKGLRMWVEVARTRSFTEQSTVKVAVGRRERIDDEGVSIEPTRGL